VRGEFIITPPVRRAKARSFSWCKSRPAAVAPAGGNRSSRRVQDFVAAWNKVMNLDRFDLA